MQTIGFILLEVDRNIINNDSIFAFCISVLDANNEMQIGAGNHEYPFQFQLPENIPSSFVGEYGRIVYSIKAVVDRPWRFDHETVAFFTVDGIYDLNMEPSALVRLLLEIF